MKSAIKTLLATALIGSSLLAHSAQSEGLKKAQELIRFGSVYKGVLLNGADVVAGIKNDNFFVIKLEGDETLGPLPSRACNVIGRGFANLNTERVTIALDGIGCVSDGGEVYEANLLGYVNDQGGKSGIKGVVKASQGAVLLDSLAKGMGSPYIEIDPGEQVTIVITSSAYLNQVGVVPVGSFRK